jgi:hypothetical protein
MLEVGGASFNIVVSRCFCKQHWMICTFSTVYYSGGEANRGTSPGRQPVQWTALKPSTPNSELNLVQVERVTLLASWVVLNIQQYR